MSRALARLARKAGIRLRPSYILVARGLLVSQSLHAHAKQYGRAKRSEVRLRVILGGLHLETTRQLDQCSGKHRLGLEALLVVGERLWKQPGKDKNKKYSVHEPHPDSRQAGKHLRVRRAPNGRRPWSRQVGCGWPDTENGKESLPKTPPAEKCDRARYRSHQKPPPSGAEFPQGQ